MTLNLTRRATKGLPLSTIDHDTNLDKLEQGIELRVLLTDPRFIDNRQLGLVSAQLADDMSNLAQTYNLPQEFVTALNQE